MKYETALRNILPTLDERDRDGSMRKVLEQVLVDAQ